MKKNDTTEEMVKWINERNNYENWQLKAQDKICMESIVKYIKWINEELKKFKSCGLKDIRINAIRKIRSDIFNVYSKLSKINKSY